MTEKFKSKYNNFIKEKINVKMFSAKWQPCCSGFTCVLPSHYLYKWWFSVNQNQRNKLQWNSNQNTVTFFKKMHMKSHLQSIRHFVLTWMCEEDPETDVTNGLWAHQWNLINFLFNIIFRSQFCTCQDSSAVVICAKLWPDLIIFFVNAMAIFIRFGLPSSL